MPSPTQHTGSTAETAAAQHLQDLGYTILERNLRVGHAEADLVALSPQGALVVVEVKARRGAWHPEDRVDSVKRGHLVRVAAALLQEERFRDRIAQFDVVAVSLDQNGAAAEVLHIPHAFDASGMGW
ncbi:MAG: YraN family protein [Phycisphaerales bacterium]